MNVLVVGGAGYIGSHVAKALHQAGHTPIVFDNFSAGKRDAVLWGECIEGDLNDFRVIEKALRATQVEAVIHLAGSIEVGESVQNPLKYYQNNTAATVNLLRAMQAVGIRKVVFSSTAAIYGNPEQESISENHPKNPVNPYGRSKLMIEEIMRDTAETGSLQYVALRYFNACGADPDGQVGENHDPESHIIPRACMAILEKVPALTIFGNDWPTPDGTPIRDYVHVTDLASAHVSALEYLVDDGKSAAFNIGTGSGHSVLEVLSCIEKISGKVVPYTFGLRREGDPKILVADSRAAQEILGWEPKHSSLEEICTTAWKWQVSR